MRTQTGQHPESVCRTMHGRHGSRPPARTCLAVAIVTLATSCVPSAVEFDTTMLYTPGGDDNVACAMASDGTVWAIGDAYEDAVDIYRNGAHVRTIARAEWTRIEGSPTFWLGGGPDGVDALAFGPQKRFLYIGLHDDAGGSDAIYRYDLEDDELGLWALANIWHRGDSFPRPDLAVAADGIVYLGTPGALLVFDSSGTPKAPIGIRDVRGIAVTAGGTVFAARSTGEVIRIAHPADAPAEHETFADLGTTLYDMAYTPAGDLAGLYVLTSAGDIHRFALADLLAETLPVPTPDTFHSQPQAYAIDVAANRLLIAMNENAKLLSLHHDGRLSINSDINFGPTPVGR